MKKRVFSMIICVVLLFSAVAVAPNVTAYTAHTQSEAVSWMYSKNGVALDWDGSYGAQCVDLIYYYYNYLGVAVMGGNAKDYAWNDLPNGWQRIRYYSGFVPQPGDIFVRTADGFVDGVYYGHIGLVISADAYNFSSMEQNYAGRQYCSSVNRKTSYIEYIIRPDFISYPSNVTLTANIANGATIPVGQTITFNLSAVGATGYYLGIWRDNIRLVDDVYSPTTVQFTPTEPGEYYAFFTARNSAGYITDSNKISWKVERVLESISIYYLPDKTEYMLGEEFDKTGLVLWLNYSGGVRKLGFNFTISGFDSSTVGIKTVTVTYKNKTTTFNVTIKEPTKPLPENPPIDNPNSGDTPAQGVPDVNESIKFTDVPSDKWYTEYVDYVAENNLMNGMSENTFAPSETLTRAMFVQILANAAGVDTGNRNVITKFADVPSGKWYTSAVLWASENGIVNGMTESTFDPQGNIQRQQVCVMLARFAKVYGIELGGSAEKVDFRDDNLIQNYAKEAVYTCQQAGIINGMTADTFAPRDNATRAQIAKIMTVFHRDFMNA